MKAEIIVNKNFTVGEIDKRIYGAFVEHLGRCVYTGIYEPGHATADESGFRGDVMELVRELDVPIVRYPGGNFVSGYNWEDGTGDKSKRTRRPDLAWRTVETNEVGIDEFQEWAKKVNSEVMMAVNLGTRGPADAANLVEYCNATTDTHYANMRRENGFDKPFGIKTWCLGNEMDGPWQICGKSAEEYGHIALQAGRMMQWMDPSVELIACGSSNYNMPTFGDWEYTVLDKAYNHVNYISMHQYYNNAANNTPDFLGRSVHLNSFIKSVAAICDAVKAKKHSQHTVNLSLDEYNVWYHSNGKTFEPWQTAPPTHQDVYNFEDALLIGSIFITMHNNCDRVKMACMAQLVNVLAPIMTEEGGKAWAQTIYYPFMLASKNGRGTTLRSIVKSESYVTSDKFTVPYLEASVVDNPESRTLTVFAVNKSLDEDMTLSLDLGGFDGAKLISHTELYCDDLKAENTKDTANVYPAEREVDASMDSVNLKKHSFNMLKFAY